MPDDQIDPTTSPSPAGDAGIPSEPTAPGADEAPAPAKRAARKTATKKATAKTATAKKTATKATTAKKTTAKRTTKKAAAAAGETPTDAPVEAAAEQPAIETPAEQPAEAAVAAEESAPAKKTTARKAAAKKTTKKAPARKKAAAEPTETISETPAADAGVETPVAAPAPESAESTEVAETAGAPAPLFQAPVAKKAPARRTRKTAAQKRAEAEAAAAAEAAEAEDAEETAEGEVALEATAASVEADAPDAESTDTESTDTESAEGDERSEDQGEDQGDSDSEGGGRRRRRRGGRRRRKSGDASEGDSAAADAESGQDASAKAGDTSEDSAADKTEGDDSDASGDSGPDEQGSSGSSRRRRRRRRSSDDGPDTGDDPDNTVTRVRKPRSAEDEITAISGSTRLEAKKQRRRDGREAGRRRAPIVSEAEFLARREAVDRVMVIRQRDDLTQIGVLEDKVLVEHYVARESQTSIIGNVYLGRVQNVLPSMEAAFIDIGKGRNAVLYAGEVNWSALGHRDGQARKIESVLSSGQSVLVQVTKDPIGHKGARLTSQISLAGRFLVYVPDGTTSGISRKLPDTERARLKALLKEIVPESAGVIVRTAAEGASEEELTHDVERLKARWEAIEAKAANKSAGAQLLYGEPDLTLKVVRDLFTEDFSSLVIQGGEAWETVQSYVADVAPDLAPRLERYFPEAHGGKDIFAEYRVEEQIAKALDRKVWLPSGGSLVIDRTEAMTVVDVNTGKFTGSGGNLEETVTKNNLEAAEEVVRQLRLRDIGGIIVVDFIDMVLESNRDLVLRRLVECLGRDRTRHQVAEVTSLGLVQMTRKRIGTGLVEAFSENCEHCHGRGVVIQDQPVEPRKGGGDDDSRGRGGRKRSGKGRGGEDSGDQGSRQSDKSATPQPAPTPKDVAAMARPENAEAAAVEVESAAPAAPAAEATDAGTEATQDAPAAAEKAPQVTQRQRRERRPRRETAPAPEQVTEPVAEAPQPVVEAPQPTETPAPQAPAEPQAPKVVTRTRRRTATRPAGSPAVVTTPVAPIIAAPPAPLPTAASLSTPEPPKVITRTRTRSVNRPAGPPSEVTSQSGGTEGEAEASVEHVPVKKKGKR
ncbi:Rne/Rng family ribonuclease [Nocardioides ochotonae]|uniref:Rne/Rng family ribonuclease n=1 Tax=Nocardioides ochotonae TaxID=2685869 RepID=UPI00140B9131|nr:ribonuclease E/G [Nocardioides ochotonae]